MAIFAGSPDDQRSLRERLRTREQRRRAEAEQRAANLAERQRLYREAGGEGEAPESFRRDLLPSGPTEEQAEQLRDFIAGGRAEQEAKQRDGELTESTLSTDILLGKRP